MSVCQRGCIVSSGRGDRTAPAARATASRGPAADRLRPCRAPGCSSSLNDSVPSSLEDELLNQGAGMVGDAQRQGTGPHLDREGADLLAHRLRDQSQRERRSRVPASDDRGIDRELVAEAQRLQRDANTALAGGADVELGRLPGSGDGLRIDAPGTEQDDEQNGDALEHTPAWRSHRIILPQFGSRQRLESRRKCR